MSSVRGNLEGQSPPTAQEGILDHPGYKAFRDHQAFGISLNRIFSRNYQELRSLLDYAATDRVLGIELVQNAHDDTVAREFRAEASRRLHNYVASTMSLAEHAMRMLRDREDAVSAEWEVKKADMLSHDEVQFIKGLRVFMQHRVLPLLGHSLRMENVNTPEATWESEVELGTDDLLAWTKWTAPARRFLQAQQGAIQIRPLLAKHFGVVTAANSWLLAALIDDNQVALAEVNRLVVERNREMLGCTYEEAEALTLRHTEERLRPRQPFPRPDQT